MNVVVALIEDRPFGQLDWEEVKGTFVELVYDPEEEPPYRVRVEGEVWDSSVDEASARVGFEDVIQDLTAQAKYQPLVEKERLGL